MSVTVAVALAVTALAVCGAAITACLSCRALSRARAFPGVPSAPHDTMTLLGVVDAAPMPIIVSNSDTGKVFLANAAARALFAAPDGSLNTITPEEIYEYPAQRATLLARLAGTGTVENFAARLIARDGRRLDMRINARRVRFHDEDALCVILRDVTDQTRVEARHHAVLSHLDAGVMMFDGNGFVTFANPAAERLLARPSGTLPGTPLATFTPLADVLGDDMPVDGALIGLDAPARGSGAVTWVRASASSLTKDGFPGSVVCSLHDVTDLKAAEDALADSSDALRTVLDGAPLPILVLRRQGGDVLLANRAAQDTFAVTTAAAGKDSAHWLDNYMDRAQRRTLVRAVLRHGTLNGHEVAVRPDGITPQWMRLTAKPLSYFGTDAIMIAFSDAGETRRLGRALAAAEEARNQAKDDLAQVVDAINSHLAEPIRSAEGAVQGLLQRLDSTAPPEVADLLGRALTSTRTIDNRLSALVEYASIGLRPMRPAMVDLAEVLHEVRRSLSMRIAGSGAVLQTESHLPILRADRAGIIRVLEHLIGNALTFRHPDRRPVIRLKATRDATDGPQRMWHLQVADNGQGIPHRHFERIFGLLQCLHPEGKHDGTGVGLAICHRIVREHGGRIWVEAIEGEGTTVHFTLPSTPADAVPVPHGNTPAARPA